MTGPEHYRRAEHLALLAYKHADRQNVPEKAADEREAAIAWAAVAQIHATLALAAASALGTGDLEARAWQEAAGTAAAR